MSAERQEYVPPRPCGGAWETVTTPRRFRLMRSEDATGVSGTGHVADGVQFPDGACVLRWRTAVASTAVYDSIEAVERIHGHDGKTAVVFLDSGHQTVQFCAVCAADHTIVGWCVFCGAGSSTVTLPPWAVASIWERAAEWGRARPDDEGKRLREELLTLRRRAGVPSCRTVKWARTMDRWAVSQPCPNGETTVYLEAESAEEALQKSIGRLPWIEPGEGEG